MGSCLADEVLLKGVREVLPEEQVNELQWLQIVPGILRTFPVAPPKLSNLIIQGGWKIHLSSHNLIPATIALVCGAQLGFHGDQNAAIFGWQCIDRVEDVALKKLRKRLTDHKRSHGCDSRLW